MDREATTAKQLRLDERNHVEEPLLDQLVGLGWQVIDLTDEKADAGHHSSRGSRHRLNPSSPTPINEFCCERTQTTR